MKKDNQIIETAEPFFFPGGPIGCLLIHGFTEAPKEMKNMGEYLKKRKMTVLGIRLTGHATHPPDMIRSRWQDWVASVEDGYHILSGSCKQIFLCGLSMGGILSLICGANLPVQGIIAISAPFSLPADRRVKYAKPFSVFAPWINKGKPDMNDQASRESHVAYPKYPTRSIAELHHLTKILPSYLERITKPVLLINSKLDQSVPLKHAKMIKGFLVNTTSVEFLTLEKSGHVVTEDVEKDTVFNYSADFILKHSKDQ